MILGHGDIASVLKEVNKSDVLYFASGVSNSKENRQSEYDREANLLVRQNKETHLVYFSSLCIFYSDTWYARHKREMERIVKVYYPKYTIVRIGNITWGDNPHTLINYFRNKTEIGEAFEVMDEWRYIIDKEEFLHWIRMIPPWSCEMNIPGRMMRVPDIIKEYVNKK